jgi:HD superfamily phosphohydrolase
MFQQVYFHKASRASDWMLTRLLRRVRESIVDGARISGIPRALAQLAREGDASLADYLALDDNVLWGALDAWRDATDERIRDLSQRLHSRRLYKTYELFGEQRKHRRELLAVARDVARKSGYCPETHVGLDAVEVVAFDDSSESLTVVFPTGVPRKPGDVSFLLGRLRGERLERVRLIFAPELREAIVQAVEE